MSRMTTIVLVFVIITVQTILGSNIKVLLRSKKICLKSHMVHFVEHISGTFFT